METLWSWAMLFFVVSIIGLALNFAVRWLWNTTRLAHQVNGWKLATFLAPVTGSLVMGTVLWAILSEVSCGHPVLETWSPDCNPRHSAQPNSPRDVDTILCRMPTGSAVLIAPGEVKQYEWFDVNLRLSTRELAILKQEAAASAAPGEVIGGVDGVRLSARMRAVLIGDDLQPESEKLPKEQPVTFATDTPWSWRVQLDSPGDHRISAELQTLLKLDGVDSWRNVDVAKAMITVKVDQVGWARRHWEWLATAVAIPIVSWILKVIWDRMNRNPVAPARRRFGKKRDS